jgi:NAD(P)-dependent dehydrogenase (short-subunit alcohol dehydrogenase family)
MRIVLTGVSRGLGNALLAQFVARGHEVHGCARSTEEIDRLNAHYGAPHAFQSVDVADASDVNAWAEQVLRQSGPPELLINNAALINANATLWQVPYDEFARVIDANIKGTFHVIRAFLPAMIDAGRGVVVNFSSTWGRTASPEVAPYCASKWGVEGLTRSLAKELPSGMAAVPLNPGVIDTEMLRSCFGAAAGRFPSAEAWARRAAPYILQLSAGDNGQPRDVPQH